MPINVIPLVLLLLAFWSAREHYLFILDAEMDAEAMHAAGHDDELTMTTVRADIRDGQTRLTAKLCLAVVFVLAAFTPRTMFAESDFVGVIATIFFVAAMLSLTYNTYHRREARDKMLFLAMAKKGEESGV